MRGMRGPGVPTVRPKAVMTGRHQMMLRRAANHNVHVITPHGKVQAGRKGRKG